MPELEKKLFKQLTDQKYALDQAAIVAATDARGVITYVNDKFCEISGYSREELIGKTHKVVNSGKHSKGFFTEMWKSISQGNVWHGEICNQSKAGNIYWVYTSIVPFVDSNGKIEQYLSIRHEITELKKAQETILEQQEKLVATSRLSAIGEMAATITHEINNPLGVILGRIEMIKEMLLEDNYEKADLQRMADTIEVTGLRIAKIVNSMKVMAHHQESDPTQKVLIQQVIQEALELCYHRFQSKGVMIEFSKGDKNLIVDCRSHEIVQVLVNLLNNSFDAIAELPERWVRIEVLDRGEKVEASITDSGRGISKEVQAKMYNPFYTTKPVQYGTGIGLSISQSILRRVKGSLEYDGQSPHTRFVISIPKEQKVKVQEGS